MLSTNDIQNLEARWKKWQVKRWGKRTGSLFLVFFIFFGGVGLYSLVGRFPLQKQTASLALDDAKNHPITSSGEKNSSSSEAPLSQQPSLVIQPIPVQPHRETISPIPLPVTEYVHQKPKEIESTEAPAPKAVETLEISPSRIDIDSKIVQRDTTAYLKEKFDATKNIVFALMLSEEYYKLEEYNGARKWALIANEINPKNERSWILFAMSQAKLNNTNEAIQALEEFLKSNSSNNAESLLDKLKKGIF